MLNQENQNFKEKLPIVYEQSYQSIIKILKFNFKTFEESKIVAHYISEHCPNPLRAEIGLNELFMNAIEHGNLGISCKEKALLLAKKNWICTVQRRLFSIENKKKKVNVIFEKTPERITIKIKDCGKGFNWEPYLCQKHNVKLNGRGILIAKEYAFDDLHYNTKGNEVTCYFVL